MIENKRVNKGLIVVERDFIKCKIGRDLEVNF